MPGREVGHLIMWSSGSVRQLSGFCAPYDACVLSMDDDWVGSVMAEERRCTGTFARFRISRAKPAQITGASENLAGARSVTLVSRESPRSPTRLLPREADMKAD